MKKLFCFACALVLICTSYALGQDVAVFYDAAVENGGGLAVPNPDQLAEMMVEELEAKKLTAEIVDSDGLAEYMKANPKESISSRKGIRRGRYLRIRARRTLFIRG